MKNYTVKQDQTIFDVALQLYGDASAIFKLISNNSIGIQDDLVGIVLTYDDSISNDLSTYYATNQISITTGSNANDIGPRAFDMSFDTSFG